MNHIISVLGPTASGKSTLSVALAEKYNAQIVSLDSMQIYRNMNIGTAKITEKEMHGIPHYMIDCIEPTEKYNVQRFVTDARKCIDSIYPQNNCILVGGTGLYFEHLIKDTQFIDMPNDFALRATLNAMPEQQLFDKLSACDPTVAARLQKNDKKRIVRALEVITLTGKSIEYWEKISHLNSNPLTVCKIGLYFENRDELYCRIDNRVDCMVKSGLEEEVRGLLTLNGFIDSTAADAIGYKEMISYIQGEITLPEATELIKKNTRHYAKRQYTWFKRYNDIHWIPVTDNFDAVIKKATDILERELP